MIGDAVEAKIFARGGWLPAIVAPGSVYADPDPGVLLGRCP